MMVEFQNAAAKAIGVALDDCFHSPGIKVACGQLLAGYIKSGEFERLSGTTDGGVQAIKDGKVYQLDVNLSFEIKPRPVKSIADEMSRALDNMVRDIHEYIPEHQGEK